MQLHSRSRSVNRMANSVGKKDPLRHKSSDCVLVTSSIHNVQILSHITLTLDGSTVVGSKVTGLPVVGSANSSGEGREEGC